MTDSLDPEVKAISAIARAMDSVDPSTHERIVKWMRDRYVEERRQTSFIKAAENYVAAVETARNETLGRPLETGVLETP